MRIKLLALLLVFVLVFMGLTGCSKIISFKSPAEKRRDSIANFIAGDVIGEGEVTGKIEETYKTKWFEFTVHSIGKVDSYADHTAERGNQLYKTLITEKNISDVTLLMGTFDFYMDAPNFEEFIRAVAPLDDTMMPEEFNLEPDETVQYVMIFEVPTGTAELALMYTEFFENEGIGTTFVIYAN